MSFELISLICKIGSIFAITPANIYSKHQNIIQKLWAVVMLVILTISTILWYTSGNFYYKNFIPAKKIMRFCRHLVKYIFCCYLIVQVNFQKRHKWVRLIEKLKKTSNFENNKKRLNLLKFLLCNFVFWIVIFYTSYVYHVYFDTGIFGMPVVIFVEWYCLFIYISLFSCISKMILARYKYVYSILRKQHENLKRSVPEKINVWMQIAETMLFELKQIIDFFNSIFGWSFMLVIFFMISLTLDYVDDFFKIIHTYTPEKFIMSFTTNIVLVLIVSVSFY